MRVAPFGTEQIASASLCFFVKKVLDAPFATEDSANPASLVSQFPAFLKYQVVASGLPPLVSQFPDSMWMLGVVLDTMKHQAVATCLAPLEPALPAVLTDQAVADGLAPMDAQFPGCTKKRNRDGAFGLTPMGALFPGSLKFPGSGKFFRL